MTSRKRGMGVLQHCPYEKSRPGLAAELVESALPRRLVRPPAQQRGAMAEAVRGDLIIAHLDHEFRPERLPLGGAFRAPPARAARGAAGEAGRLDERFELVSEGPLFGGRQGRSEADVVQQSVVAIEAQK